MNVGVKSKKKLSEMLANTDETKNEKRTLYRSLWTSQTQLPVLQEAIADYDIVRQVGKGTFSTVYYAHHRKNANPGGPKRNILVSNPPGGDNLAEGKEEKGKSDDDTRGKSKHAMSGDGVAIKLIDKNRVTQSSDVRKVIRNVRRINTEVDIMRTAQHEGICQVLHAFQTDQHVFIVLEYAERDLFHFLSSYANGLPSQLAQYLNRIIALSIRHLHTRKIAHRDLKPENILVKGDLANNNLIVKLCDFGLSLRPETKCADFVGSPGFFAPEILIDAVYDAFAADIWSYGALLIETVCGTPTFESLWLRAYRFLDRHDVFRELISECVQKLPTISSLTRDPDLFRLVTGVLRINAEQRDTIATVVMNPWLYLVTESEENPGQLEILRLTIVDLHDDATPKNNNGYPVSADNNVDGSQQGCKRRDALMSIALEPQKHAPRRPDNANSPSAHSTTNQNGDSSSLNVWQRSRSMTMGMFSRKNIRKPQLPADEYTLPLMTICHLDDSAVVRQVVQAKLSMAFPNHNLVNFADSTHLIHTIMASQEKTGDSASASSGGSCRPGPSIETIRICIFDENIGEDLKGSDLASMLIKLGYKGLILCMTANEEMRANDTHVIFDGVLSKQITTNKLKSQLVAAWKTRFGQSALVPVVKLAPPSEDEDFHSLRIKCLEQMIRNPKPKLKRVELLEMKGDLESVRSSQALLEQVRDLIQTTSAEEYIRFTEDTTLYIAIKQELMAHDLTHREKAASSSSPPGTTHTAQSNHR